MIENKTRYEKVHYHTFKLKNSKGSKAIRYYFIKNIEYGAYIECYDYNKVQIAFSSQRESYEKAKTGKKRDFSVKRARATLYQIAEANRGRHGQYREVFFTLTSKDQSKEYKESNAKIKTFIKRLNRYAKRAIKYIIVPELHKTGAIHYHGIFFNLPYIPVRYFKERLWKYGFVDLQVAKDVKNTSAYIAKYLTKSYHNSTPLNTKLYFTSRGLFRPTVTFTDQRPQGKLSVEALAFTKYYQKIKYKKCDKNFISSNKLQEQVKKDTHTTLS